MLVDDHQMVRDGLEQILNSCEDIHVVASVGAGAAAVARAADDDVDVALMDLSMPVMDGNEATRQLTAAHPDIKVVILTTFSDQPRILEAVRGGAAGYVLKDASPDEVIAAVRSVMTGGAPLDPKAARVLLDAQRAPANEPKLSGREREVLAELANGLANKQIARRLGITERTVKAHLTSIFQQLGVTDRTQAALWAQENL
jgi:DNA-binding NarL/FixJ family response regulator